MGSGAGGEAVMIAAALLMIGGGLMMLGAALMLWAVKP